MKKILSLIISVIFTVQALGMGYAYANEVNTEETPAADKSQEEANIYFDLAVSLIMSNYKFDVNREDLYRAAIEHLLKENPELLEKAFEGLFGSLDKYSTYYTQEQLDSFFSNISGEFCGIGVIITSTDEGLLVTTVYDDSPAKEAGIIAGDIISKVGDFSLAGVDVAIAQSKIIGKENTPVNLTIIRNGVSFETNIIRRKIVIESGFYQTVANDTIGYIELDDFNEHACEFVKKALDSFDQKGITNIILDLRNNPGGSAEVMVDISSLFIPTGPAIHFEFKNPFRNKTLYAYNENVKYKLAVLVNENSASASEAFSAAVQDTGVGIVVGTKTFGKGTMQNITKFKIGGGVKLTEAEFLSPNKRHINGIGVSPDVYVEDKIVDYHNSNYTKITYDRVMKSGDKGKDVYALEERLYFLGYNIGLPDEIYDERTHIAIYNFQKSTELYPYGVADITTQLKLEEVLNGNKVIQNDSLTKAIDIFLNHDINEFKQDWPSSSEE